MNPDHMWPGGGKKPENPIDTMSDGFAEFINHPGYSADQVRAAYYRLVGVSVPADTDPVVETILAEMQRLEKEHFPINRFSEFIGTLQKIEDTVPAYFRFVESLPVTANEKSLLRSLANMERTGVLEIAVAGKLSTKISFQGEGWSPELRADELLHALKLATSQITTGQSLEFTFIE